MATKNTLKISGLSHALQVKLRRILMRLAAELEGEYRQEVNALGGTYTGQLKGSIVGVRVPTVSGEMAIRVGTPLEHGAYYEYGTVPHMPPHGAIRRWVELKVQPHVLAIGTKFEIGRSTPKGTKILRGNKRKRAIERVTWAIRKAMAEHGTEAHKPLGNALTRLGIPFIEVKRETGDTYEIDAVSYVQKQYPDLWAAVADEAKPAGGATA